jgi:hypothetical protein
MSRRKKVSDKRVEQVAQDHWDTFTWRDKLAYGLHWLLTKVETKLQQWHEWAERNK